MCPEQKHGRRGYNDGMTTRRLKLLSCFLVLLLAGGGALPPLAIWQCRHAARVVAAAVAPPAAMPCRMGDKPMPPMACCRPQRAVVRQHPSSRQVLSSRACQPTFTRLVTPAVAGITGHAHLRRILASVPPASPPPAPRLPSVPATLALRQRPPPTVGQPLSAPEHAPGLRAPPAA